MQVILLDKIAKNLGDSVKVKAGYVEIIFCRKEKRCWRQRKFSHYREQKAELEKMEESKSKAVKKGEWFRIDPINFCKSWRGRKIIWSVPRYMRRDK